MSEKDGGWWEDGGWVFKGWGIEEWHEREGR